MVPETNFLKISKTTSTLYLQSMLAYKWFLHTPYIISFNPKNTGLIRILVPTSEIKNLRPKAVKQLAHGHRDSK